MKTTDIKVGEDYAYTTYLARRRDNRNHASRVRVVDLDGKITKKPRHSWEQTKVERGIVVVAVDDATGRKERGGQPFVVQPKHLVDTWDSKAAADDYVGNLKRQALTRRNIEAKNIKAIVAKKAPWWVQDKPYTDGSFSSRGDISISDLHDLLRAAYDKGLADGADGTRVVFVDVPEEEF